MNALVIGQVFYLLNSRYKLDSSLSLRAHLGNPYLPLGIGAVVVLQLLFTYAPPLQALFETEAMPLRLWPPLFVGGLLFFLVVEAEKLILRTRARSSRGAPALAPASLGTGRLPEDMSAPVARGPGHRRRHRRVDGGTGPRRRRVRRRDPRGARTHRRPHLDLARARPACRPGSIVDPWLRGQPDRAARPAARHRDRPHQHLQRDTGTLPLDGPLRRGRSPAQQRRDRRDVRDDGGLPRLRRRQAEGGPGNVHAGGRGEPSPPARATTPITAAA